LCCRRTGCLTITASKIHRLTLPLTFIMLTVINSVIHKLFACNSRTTCMK
jgi:hypothetical protein